MQEDKADTVTGERAGWVGGGASIRAVRQMREIHFVSFNTVPVEVNVNSQQIIKLTRLSPTLPLSVAL